MDLMSIHAHSRHKETMSQKYILASSSVSEEWPDEAPSVALPTHGVAQVIILICEICDLATYPFTCIYPTLHPPTLLVLPVSFIHPTIYLNDIVLVLFVFYFTFTFTFSIFPFPCSFALF